MPKIVITRASEFVNRMRTISIYLDGAKIGAISNGEVKDFEVPAGAHSLYAKVNWVRSNEIELQIAGSEKKYFSLSNYKYSNAVAIVTLVIIIAHLIARRVFGINWIAWLVIPSFLFILYQITIGRANYLRLKEEENF